MAHQITNEFVVLCEGEADQAFLQALMQQRGGFPPCDMLPFQQYFGVTNFDKMLRALRGNPTSFARVRGVLLIADVANSAKTTFGAITQQIKDVGGYPVPEATETIAGDPNSEYPAVQVSLLPSPASLGGLETLYVQERLRREPWIGECLDAFFSCGEMDTKSWASEKYFKAAFACIVASRHQNDPTRAASKAFRTPPTVDISSEIFNDAEAMLRTFCRAIGA